MALRNIFQEGEQILRKRSREVTTFDERLHVLIDDMWDTMHHANGVGLAGPQVGICKRVVIVEAADDDRLELVNPVIKNTSGEQLGMEGCLSVSPSKNGKVLRPMSLTVEAQDRNGKPITVNATDWKARIICHECDHLDGVLFIDKVVKE